MLSHTPGNKRLEQAIHFGHVVKANRVKFWNDAVTPEQQTTAWYYAAYAYKASGKQYTYKYLEHEYPPVVIKLYYMNNPRKVFCEKNECDIHNPVLCHSDCSGSRYCVPAWRGLTEYEISLSIFFLLQPAVFLALFIIASLELP